MPRGKGRKCLGRREKEMTTCDYCGKTVESEQAAITGIGWVVCPTCAKVYGKLDGIVTKAEKPQLAGQG